MESFIDPREIETAVNWKRPTNASEILSFLGMAWYYRRFVEVFSHITSLTYLMQKIAKFTWIEKCEWSFQIKTSWIWAPILVYFTNKDLLLIALLFKKGLDVFLVRMERFWHKLWDNWSRMNKTILTITYEQNYPTYGLELVAIFLS